MKKLTIRQGLETGELIEKNGNIYDIKKLEESKDPDCKYTGEVVGIYGYGVHCRADAYIAYVLKISLKKTRTTSYSGLEFCDFVGDVERQYFESPCGEGEVFVENDQTPGYRDIDAFCRCDKCREIYHFEPLGCSNILVVERSEKVENPVLKQ